MIVFTVSSRKEMNVLTVYSRTKNGCVHVEF